MNRTDVINKIAEKEKIQSYLEIGVRNPIDNFDMINVENKVGIDSKAKRNDIIQIDSDTYFAEFDDKFDLIFIDGDHSYEQCKRDCMHALKHLNKGGYIVMHDCIPINEKERAETKNGGKPWCGQCWLVYAELKKRKDLKCFIVDVDHGVGIIKRGRPNKVLIDIPNKPWEIESKKALEVVSPIIFNKGYQA